MNANSVLKDLRTSGLMDVLRREGMNFHVILLEEMAKLADQCGGRECTVTYAQCADLMGIDRRLEQDKRIEPIKKIVESLIGSGIIDVVPKQHPQSYRVAKLQVLKAVTANILSKRVYLPAVSFQFLAR
ncbi:MAG: hypothetical protein OXG88_06000 [Gammaproteobacteria bacterium]|nr:hypothetical protein [Gammaproteobacteria bacterium]